MKLVVVLQLFLITPVTIFALPTIKGLSRFPHICPDHTDSDDQSNIPEKTRMISNSNVIKVSDWQPISVPIVLERSIEKHPALLKDNRLFIDIPLVETNNIHEPESINEQYGEQYKTEQLLDIVTPNIKQEGQDIQKVVVKPVDAVDEVEAKQEEEVENIGENEDISNIVEKPISIENKDKILRHEGDAVKETQEEDNQKIKFEENSQDLSAESSKVLAGEGYQIKGEDQPENQILHFKTIADDIGCVCALFSSKCPVESDVPLMSKTYYNVSCHEQVSGEDACMKTCIAFTLSYYEMKDDLICSHAKNAVHLSVYLHSRMCGKNNEWAFTGLMSPKSVCCIEGAVIPCEENML